MNTTEPRLVCVENTADLPILWSILVRIGLVAHLDQHIPAPPRWKGPLTPGEAIALWLLFILSESDHCLSHVEPWAEQNQRTLSILVDKPVQPSDLHDDRLAYLLDRISVDGVWRGIETDLNTQTLRVYQLKTDVIRIDTTTANSYADVVTEQGLLQFGHSKDDPSRPQLKIATAILDPLGMPLATAVVSGNTADDPLYIPAIGSVQKTLGIGGKTYVGDCKMSSLGTRAFVASGGDFYLCPLSEVQLNAAKRQELLQPIWDGTQQLHRVERPGAAGVGESEGAELVAEGFSIDVEMTGQVGEKEVVWIERRWLVRSCAYAAAESAGLDRRLGKAVAAIQALGTRKQGKKRLSESDMAEAVLAIQAKERVVGLLDVTIQATTTTEEKRGYHGKPNTTETKVERTVEVRQNDEAIASRKQELGWQVYATNGLEMGLAQVVWGYRGQYRIENDWSRLKGRPLGLTPMYLQNEERMQGLVHLLSLALRVLILVEWQVRERLRETEEKLRNIYSGQPGRKTDRPSAEMLLKAMKTIYVTLIEVNGKVYAIMKPLTALQKKLLDLWDLPPDLYENIVSEFVKSPADMSEP